MALNLLFSLSFVIFEKFTNFKAFKGGTVLKTKIYNNIRSNQYVYSENYAVFYGFMSFEIHRKKNFKLIKRLNQVLSGPGFENISKII